MKKFLLMPCLLIPYLLNAQTLIWGTVSDGGGEPVPYAVVSLSDTLPHDIITYTTTDEKGRYSFSAVRRQDSLRISVRSLGYSIQHKTVPKGDTVRVDFVLEDEVVELEEVSVRGKYTGIRYIGDTIKYNTDLFRDGSERKLGDLLDKLPGIEVEEGGNIKAQGKNVEKLLFNGNDLFNGSVQLATKNISSDIVKDVEILNNYSEYSLLKGFQSHEGTAINVNVKDKFLNNLSGDAVVGGGFKGRYKTHGNFMMLKPTHMTSFIGALNNTGEELLNIIDFIRMQGSLEELVGTNENTGELRLSETESSMLMPSPNVDSRKNRLASWNLAMQPSTKWKLNATILYNAKTEEEQENNTRTYLLPQGEETWRTKNDSQSRKKNGIYGATFKLKSNPSESLSINYTGKMDNTNSSKNGVETLTRRWQEINVSDKKSTESVKTSHIFSFIRKLNRNLLTSEIKFSYEKLDDEYQILADSMILPLQLVLSGDIYNAGQEQRRRNTSASANVFYHYKIRNGILLQSGASFGYSRHHWQSIIIDYAFSSEAWDKDSLRNDIVTETIHPKIHLNLVKNAGFFRYKIGFFSSFLDVTDRPHMELGGKRRRVRPDWNISFHFSPKNILSASWRIRDIPIAANAWAKNMYFKDFQTYQMAHNLNSRFYKMQSVRLSYQFYDLFSNTMLHAGIGYSRKDGELTSNLFSNGLTLAHQAVTSPETHDVLGNIILDKGFDFPWKVTLNSMYNNQFLYNQIRGEGNRIRMEILNNKLLVFSNYKVFNVEMSSNYEHARCKYGLTQDKSRQNTFSYGCTLKLNLRQKFLAEIGGKHLQTLYNDMERSRFLLDFSIRYALNRHLELSVAGRNVLHLSNEEWVRTTLTDLYRSERIYRQLPGHIIMNVQYTL